MWSILSSCKSPHTSAVTQAYIYWSLWPSSDTGAVTSSNSSSSSSRHAALLSSGKCMHSVNGIQCTTCYWLFHSVQAVITEPAALQNSVLWRSWQWRPPSTSPRRVPCKLDTTVKVNICQRIHNTVVFHWSTVRYREGFSTATRHRLQL